MDNHQSIEDTLKNIVSKVAEKLEIKNHKIILNIGNQSKNGFTGEMFKATLENTDLGEKKHLIIKKSFDLKEQPIMHNLLQRLYQNEIYFYTELIEKWEQFQQEIGIKDVFKPFPKCLLSTTVSPRFLVFEDISYLGFEMWPKQKPLPEDLLISIFKMYGKFHALSFAFKHQRQGDYEDLTRKIVNARNSDPGIAAEMSKSVLATLKKLQTKVDKTVAQKMNKFIENFINELNPKYSGKYSCIIHGDCWSNNIMLKYSKDDSPRILEQMTMLDFQMCVEHTPALDLSNFFYTGATKDDFDKLDFYLHEYYNSFSEFSKQLGEDPSKIFPYDALKEDWKSYGTFGLVTALYVLKIKLTSDQDTEESFKDKTVSGDMFDSLKFNNELYCEKIIELINHLAEINVL